MRVVSGAGKGEACAPIPFVVSDGLPAFFFFFYLFLFLFVFRATTIKICNSERRARVSVLLKLSVVFTSATLASDLISCCTLR